MCDKKAIILFWATMVIEKHWNNAYVAQSEEISWKTWHRQGQIVFVFEDRIEFEVPWLPEVLVSFTLFPLVFILHEAKRS
jgi:hypothetical protein